jgi:hypothetical protein
MSWNIKKEHHFITVKGSNFEAVALFVDINLNFVDIETPVKIWPAKLINRNSYHAQLKVTTQLTFIHD